MEETKIIYYIDDDKMPYLIKLNVAPDKATLKEFKNALNVNVKNYRYFFQTVDDDFGNVKEELMEDEHKLPNSNGRVIGWLMTIEGSIAGSDTRSQNSLNTIEPASRQGVEAGGGNGMEHQFSSMHSLSSTASSSVSNNENREHRRQQQQHQGKAKNDNNYQNSGQIYDTLNNRKSGASKNRHQQGAPLKDLNADDTSTETESLINAFDDMRMMNHNNNRPTSSQHHAGSLAGSMKRNSKPHFSSFNNHQMNPHHHKANGKQKLSLDSHQTNRAMNNYQMTNGHHNHNQYQSNYGHHVGLAVAKPKSKQQHQDSFSDDDDDDFDDESTNIGLTRTETGAAPSILSSDLDTTTFFDTENDEDDGQFSSITAETTNSTMSTNKRYGQNRNRRKMRHKTHLSNLKGHNSLHSSISSLADSTMSLNIITVCLNMDSVNFLGISIVGQSNKGGEGGIYVGSIMSGGAVARDGRIEPGDMILQVNDISFENMSNDDAVKVLREAVMKPGPVKLVVAKCWDLSPKGYFTISKQEPVRPIDPSAWVAHTQAHTGVYPPGSNNYQNTGLKPHHRLTHSISTFGSNSSLTSSIADSTLNTTYNNAVGYNGMGGNNLATTVTTAADSTRFGNEHLNLTVNTDMETVVRAMAASDSGLEIKDRNWLKITIPMAFLGSDVVDWLFNHVEGFPDRRDARKYACNMLKYGYIRHAVNKVRFSEQCYYIFGDFNQSTLNSQLFMNGGPGGNLFTLNEESEVDFDSVSELDRDTLYAPMNFPPPPVPGSIYNNINLYQQHPKIYSNLNGIGGPAPPASYMSSSSSNATSNSTSTTSNNTTTQTIATTAIGGNGNNGSFNSTANQNSTVNTNKIYGGGIINSDRSNACQFYYPPPNLELTSFNNTTTNTSNMTNSMFQQRNHFYNDSQDETIDQTTQQSQFTVDNNSTVNNTTTFNQPPNSILSQSQYSANYQISNNQLAKQQNYSIQSSVYNNSAVSNGSKHENKSIKSSDRDSSSGHGSDVELLSSSKSKSKKNRSQLFQFSSKSTSVTQQTVSVSNYYEVGQFNAPATTNSSSMSQIKANGAPTSSTTSSTSSSSSSSSNQNADARSLDKIPRDLRLSKQSFHAAMGNPCEFFVDVM